MNVPAAPWLGAPSHFVTTGSATTPRGNDNSRSVQSPTTSLGNASVRASVNGNASSAPFAPRAPAHVAVSHGCATVTSQNDEHSSKPSPPTSHVARTANENVPSGALALASSGSIASVAFAGIATSPELTPVGVHNALTRTSNDAPSRRFTSTGTSNGAPRTTGTEGARTVIENGAGAATDTGMRVSVVVQIGWSLRTVTSGSTCA